MKNAIFPLFLSIILCSCSYLDKNETNLSDSDLELVNSYISLEKDEKIQCFETNGGLSGIKTSGNLITSKRLISYWKEDDSLELYSSHYQWIDSLKMIDNSRSLSYASYLQVYSSKNGNFKVYLDEDSTRVKFFFTKAISNWEKSKARF